MRVNIDIDLRSFTSLFFVSSCNFSILLLTFHAPSVGCSNRRLFKYMNYTPAITGSQHLGLFLAGTPTFDLKASLPHILLAARAWNQDQDFMVQLSLEFLPGRANYYRWFTPLCGLELYDPSDAHPYPQEARSCTSPCSYKNVPIASTRLSSISSVFFRFHITSRHYCSVATTYCATLCFPTVAVPLLDLSSRSPVCFRSSTMSRQCSSIMIILCGSPLPLKSLREQIPGRPFGICH